MGGPNILKYERFHSIGVHKDGPELKTLKDKALENVQLMEPILARGGLDHLINFIPNIDPPKLQWNLQVLQQLDIGQLLSIRGVLENRLELQTKTY